MLAAAQAWQPHATVMSRPGGRFQDPDAAFHARRAERAIRAGTLLPPVFDAFENFPAGGRAVWPPLHDATLALVARLGGSTSAAPERGLRTAAVVPVVELVLAVVVAAALAAKAGGAAGGAAAAVLFAAMPTIIVRGGFGEIDHNMTEVLGALLLFLAARAVSSGEETGPWRLSLRAAGWGAAVLVAVGFHTGLLLSAGVAAAAALAAALFEGKGSVAPLAGGFALGVRRAPVPRGAAREAGRGRSLAARTRVRPRPRHRCDRLRRRGAGISA